MEATTRAPVATRAGRSSASHAATPGPCSPTALTMPAGTVWRRGAALPDHGYGASDLATTAPRAARSTAPASSAPCPAVPDAVSTGLGRTTEPTVAVRSAVGIPPNRRTALVGPGEGSASEEPELSGDEAKRIRTKKDQECPP